MTDQATNNWALGALYTPTGELMSLTMGSKAGFSGITIADQYNPRLQPATLSASTPLGQVFGLSYYYGWGASNNGDVQIINNAVDATRSVEYTYDTVNRLYQGFSYTTYAWGNIYIYDGWGNLLQKTNMPTKTLGESWNIGVDNNNHLAGYSYDGAGNLTNVNGFSGTVYNAENQWIQQTHFGINYTYDGVGRRVEATGGSSGTRVYWYDESGNVLSESDQNGVFQNDYIYFNGQKITWVDLGHGQPTTNNYYLTDHLGNNRMIITQVGTVCYDADFYPWGAEQYVKTNTCPVQNYKFTGKERDPDMGEDYFGARFYKGDMSRFFSPDWSSDPEPVPYAKLDNPQTLNLYSYVGNNPTTLRDLDGHFFINGAAAAQQGAKTVAQQNADTQTKQQDSQAQNQANENTPVGHTTEGDLAKTMTHEDGSLSTPKGGNPDVLGDAKEALANTLINNADLTKPAQVATPDRPASAQDAQVMKDAVTNRANGGADPVEGRTQFGTTHNPHVQWRPAGNHLKGAAGRETVYEKFGPFKDSTSRRPTWIVIYNNPGQ